MKNLLDELMEVANATILDEKNTEEKNQVLENIEDIKIVQEEAAAYLLGGVR